MAGTQKLILFYTIDIIANGREGSLFWEEGIPSSWANLVEHWGNGGHKREQRVDWHWSWAGGSCQGGVAVVGWALQWSLLHVNHSLFCAFLLLILLLILLLCFLLISVLFPVNCSYFSLWSLPLFPPILLSILTKK